VKVVICGSFWRDLESLRRDFREFQELGCEIVSPKSLDFVGPFKDGFAPLAGEEGKSITEIENGHLEAMRTADFVWFHAPQSYVGEHSRIEIGFALALKKPTYSRGCIGWSVKYVNSPTEALRLMTR
jgi:hypothetical protein